MPGPLPRTAHVWDSSNTGWANSRVVLDNGGALPSLAIVVPIYNEEACIPVLVDRLDRLRNALSATAEVEYIFVDDGSSDDSLPLLFEIAGSRTYARVLGLSRNFGHQLAVTAGIDVANADWVAIIDADLQDPPEAIAPMFHRAQEGYDVVYGRRRSRSGETAFKTLSAQLFYRAMEKLVDVNIPRDTGDFRLMSRRVVLALQSMREQHRFLRGMIPWLGFTSVEYLYDRDARHSGTTKYPLRKMFRLAANAAVSFSAKPLILATKMGLLMAFCGGIGALCMIYLKIFTNVPVPGVTSILVALALFGGIQISILGLLGEYVARVFDEVKGRPLYVVAHTKNVITDAATFRHHGERYN